MILKISIDDSFRRLAKEYMLSQVGRLSVQIDGIRKNEDIEFVHRARVASRRLRAAFNIFNPCLSRKISSVKKQIRCLTKDLGDARDLDVQIEFLKKYLQKSKRDRTSQFGVKRLLQRLQDKRNTHQPKAIKTLNRIQAKQTLDNINEIACSLLEGTEDQNIPVQSPYVFQQASHHIITYLQEVESYQRYLDNPIQTQKHHAMRIACKRLRYTMEICNPAFNKKLTPYIDSVKKMQSYLGKIHDCDVWQERILEFLGTERRGIVTYAENPQRTAEKLEIGVGKLAIERQKERGKVFMKAVAFWKGLEQKEWAKQLRNLVLSYGKKETTSIRRPGILKIKPSSKTRKKKNVSVKKKKRNVASKR